MKYQHAGEDIIDINNRKNTRKMFVTVTKFKLPNHPQRLDNILSLFTQSGGSKNKILS